MKNFAFLLLFILILTSCNIKVETLYHSDATMENIVKIKANEELANKMKSKAQTKNKKEALDKYLNKKQNLHDVFVENNLYDSLGVKKLDLFKKINFKVVSDTANQKLSVSLTLDRYKMKEMEGLLEQFYTAMDANAKTEQQREKNKKQLEDLKRLFGKSNQSWDGKKLLMKVEKETPDKEKGEMTAEQAEQMMSMMSSMLGGGITVEYYLKFDKNIKKFESDNPLYSQIDDKTIGYKYNIIELLTKSPSKAQVKVATK